MLKLLKWFLGLFSPYVNSFERRVDKFFKNVKSTDSLATIKKGLNNLMQENLMIVNVWLEKKFKGYLYLKKSARKRMYEDTEKIKGLLDEFVKNSKVTQKEISELLQSQGLGFPNGDEEKILYLYQIMLFLRPGVYYRYIKTASFGKLLRDPNREKLEGDCNQIVTLYIYLFTLEFPVEDVQIKLLPEHVCLHFRGIDIECTNGTFQKYTEAEEVLPSTEIISTNLLDLADFREDVQKISERDMVKSAQLAYAISSLKPLVAKNLEIAYKNLAASALKVKNFDSAIFFLSKTSDRKNLNVVYRNACIHYLDQKNFSKARYYASQAGDSDLKKAVDQGECAKRYNYLVKKVAGVKTLADAKRKKSTYREMLTLAQKMGNHELEKSVRDTLSKI